MSLTKKTLSLIFSIVIFCSMTSCSDSFEREFGKNIENGVFNPSDSYSTIISDIEENGYYKLTMNFKNKEDVFYTGNLSGNSEVYDVPLYYYKFDDGLVFKVTLNELSFIDPELTSKLEENTALLLNDFYFIVNKQEDVIVGYYNNNKKNKVNITVSPYSIGQESVSYQEVSSLGLLNNTERLNRLISPIKIEFCNGINNENKISIKLNDKIEFNENVSVQKIFRNKFNAAFYNDVMLSYSYISNDISKTKLNLLYKTVEFNLKDEETYLKYIKDYFKEVYSTENFKEKKVAYKKRDFCLYQISNDKYLPCFCIKTEYSIILFSWIQTGDDYLSVSQSGVEVSNVYANIERIIKI